MRILLTGGTGYIGSHTCVELLNNDYEVIDNLKIHPTVQDLFNIHRQYNNKSFVFGGCTPNDATTPLYFTEPGPIIQQLNGSSLNHLYLVLRGGCCKRLFNSI